MQFFSISVTFQHLCLGTANPVLQGVEPFGIPLLSPSVPTVSPAPNWINTVHNTTLGDHVWIASLSIQGMELVADKPG